MKPAVPEVKLGVSEGGAFDASWSQDGKQLYFLSGRGEGGTTQLWKTDVSGAKAEQVTRLPLDIAAYRITPDGKGIVVSLAIDEACKDDAITCTVTKNKARAADKSSGMVYTKLFVRHWDTWADGTRNHLYYAPMDGSTPPVALMPGFDGDVPSKPWGGAEDFFISPDSRTVYFAARFAGTTEPWSTNFDIFSVPITGDDLDQADGVGCGAIDGLRAVLDCMTNPHLVEDHVGQVFARWQDACLQSDEASGFRS